MNIAEQRDRWIADGAPPVPTVVVDGAANVLQHPSQAALILGFEAPPALRDARRVAWDVDAIAHAWVEVAAATPWNTLLAPVPGYGRTPLALTVDALVGIAALAAALASGWFHWPGNPRTGELGDASLVAYEASIVAELDARDELLAFAEPRATAWRRMIVERDEELRTAPERPVRAPRGGLTLVELLEAQRLHAAQHYRQATTAIAARGHGTPELDLATLDGLQLPDAIF